MGKLISNFHFTDKGIHLEYKDAAVYDDDEFFGNYLTRRHRAESPNDIIEKPVLMELIGDVSGKKCWI